MTVGGRMIVEVEERRDGTNGAKHRTLRFAMMFGVGETAIRFHARVQPRAPGCRALRVRRDRVRHDKACVLRCDQAVTRQAGGWSSACCQVAWQLWQVSWSTRRMPPQLAHVTIALRGRIIRYEM